MSDSKIKVRDITLKIILPGRFSNSHSQKPNDNLLIKIWKADNPKRFQNMEHWKIEREFNKLSRNRKENIAKNRKWYFGLKQNPPEEYFPIPFFHKDRETVPCYKILNLSSEHIAEFIDVSNVPSKFMRRKKDWEKMSERQRLEFHFDQISENYSYEWKYVE
jgi:hypothetical protein